MTAWIVVCVLGVLGVVFATLVVDGLLVANDRRRYSTPPSRLHRRVGADGCSRVDCQKDHHWDDWSQLDQWDHQ